MNQTMSPGFVLASPAPRVFTVLVLFAPCSSMTGHQPTSRE
jgi:hypothetical protein